MSEPVFLVGTQRSGTTLLCRMLTAHPQVFIKNELPVRQVFRQGANRSDIVEGIDYFVRQQYGCGITQLLEKEGKTRWGLKDPELTDYLELLEQFLPDARFVIIIRDARAVVNSYMENKWGLGTNAYTGAWRWRNEVATQLEFQARFPESTLVIHYEDLVSRQESVLHEVSRFLDLEFSDEMLNYAESKSYVIPSRENRNTFSKPDPRIGEKWKSRLTDRQVRVIEFVAGDLIEQLGYSLVNSNRSYVITPWERRYYQLHQAVVGEFQIQYRWRVQGWKRRLLSRVPGNG